MADAFGNALGNSIVSEMQLRDQKKNLGFAGSMTYDDAIKRGATPERALAMGQAADQQRVTQMAQELAGGGGVNFAGVQAPEESDSIFKGGDYMVADAGQTLSDANVDGSSQGGYVKVEFGATQGDAEVGQINATQAGLGLGYGLGQTAWNAVTRTAQMANTLIGANLDLLAKPFGINAFSQHTEAFHAGTTGFGDFLANEPLEQISQSVGEYFDAMNEAYQAGDSFEAFRLGGRGLGEIGLLAVGGFGTISRGGSSSTLALGGVGSAGRVPNAGGHVRQFTQQGDRIYYRVYSDKPTGSFLTAVPPRSSAYAREALALPPENQATYIQEVLVPDGTPLLRSRALPQPAWGRTRGGAEQFELLNKIPSENFGPGRPLP